MDLTKLVLATVVVFLALGSTGCATGSYTAPKAYDEPPNYSAVVPRPFDQTWTAMVDHASGTFFAIENFEKESGLMTLTFGSSNPSEFVDCGEFTAKTPAEQFNGKYLDFLTRYYNASLSGKMNILVRPVGADQTQVRVNARYIVTVPSTPQIRGEQYAFDSGGRDVKVISNAMAGTTNTRICQPTYKAENSILEAISDLAQR